jgi:flavin reductase (DIM6/NTAB) family NADH-FMN oxidoreductase RutF
LGKTHYTIQGIELNKTFSINIPSKKQMAITDYCGLVSGKQEDKAKLFSVFYGKTKTAPMIEDCPVNIELKMQNKIIFSKDICYFGEVQEIYVSEDCISDSLPDLKKIDPLLLSMPDNHYWSIGEIVGNAWSIGKSFKK